MLPARTLLDLGHYRARRALYSRNASSVASATAEIASLIGNDFGVAGRRAKKHAFQNSTSSGRAVARSIIQPPAPKLLLLVQSDYLTREE